MAENLADVKIKVKFSLNEIISAIQELGPEEKKRFGKMLEDLIGTRGAYILDEKMNILGKVPSSELASTIKSLSTSVHAIVLDGDIDSALVASAEKSNVKYLVGMSSRVKGPTKVQIITANEL